MINVPKRRFKGFTGSWQERKLLDNVIKIIDFRGRTPKKLGLDWSEEGYLALSAANVRQGYIDKSIDPHYGNQELYDAWMVGNELHKGQVLFTTEAPMGNVAQVPDNEKYILSQRTIAFEVDEGIISEDYLAVVLRSPKIFDRLTSLSSGGTAKGVSQKSLSELRIPVPNSIEEQSKIGEFSRKVGSLITLHQHKLEKLQAMKQAYLHDMFPAEGEKVPKRRFAGFTDPWEQCTLSELAEFNPKAELPDNFRYVDLESVVGTELIAYRVESKATAPSRAQRLAKQGDLFYQMVRPYQKNNYLFEKPCENYVFSTGYAQMRPQNNGYFLLCLVQTESFVKAVLNRCTGTSYPAISSSDLADIRVFVPKNVGEENTIALFFRTIDNLIILQQSTVEKLQAIKQAFLHEMFV